MNETRSLFFVSIPFVLVLSTVCLSNFGIVFAQERLAGVKKDDWAKYDLVNLTGTLQIGDTNLTEVFPEWFKNTVQYSELSGVSFHSVWHWANGTETTHPFWINTINSEGYYFLIDFIAVNLNPGDIVTDEPYAYDEDGHMVTKMYYIKEWKINETVSRTYLGISRETNHLNVTYIDPGGTINNMDYLWDRQTGIMTEVVWKAISDEGSLLLSYQIVDTNLWGDKTSPIANFSYTVSGLSFLFDADQSTDNVGIVSYNWNFGDGNSETGKTFAYTYSNAGTYEVTLTVKDAAGNSDTQSRIITATYLSEGIPWWTLAIVGIVIVGIGLGALSVWRRKSRIEATPATPPPPHPEGTETSIE